MYRLDVTLSRESDVVDEVTEFFGIRDIRFSAENGFELNGRKVILNGGTYITTTVASGQPNTTGRR